MIPEHSQHRYERLYRIMVEDLPDVAIFLTDSDGIVTSWNPGVQNIFGYSEQEFLGSFFGRLYTRQDREAGKPSGDMRRAIDNGQAVCSRWLIHKDGAGVYADGVLTALRDPAGQLLGFAKLIRDNTARVRERDALLAAERRLDAIVESIEDGFVALDTDFRYTFLNAAAERLMGVKREERIGRCFWDTSAQVVGTDVEERYRRVMRDRRPERFEYRNMHGDRWFQVNIYPDPAGGITVFFQDITDRKQKEAERDRLQRAVDMAQIFVRKLDGTIVDWSRGSERLYGYRKREALGQKAHELLKTVFPQPIQELRAHLEDTGIWSGELEHTTKDGRKVCVASHWVLEASNGQSALVVDVSNDVTELKDAEAKLSALNEELRRSNHDLGQFAYVVSHDLQSPLRHVLSYAELLQRDMAGQLPADAQEYLQTVLDAAGRMRQFIQDLLSYAQSGNVARPREDVDTSGVVQLCESNSRLLLNETGGQISSSGLPVVKGDSLELMQVFSNLINNALKYRSEQPPQIAISSQDSEGYWKFAVADNGIGIDPRYAERIFGVFKRLHGPEYPGTGIGLAICKKIVERNGGRIWVESQPGQGATFYFTWPK